YLASLPKGPSNYHPFRHTERAIERRHWVIDQMRANGYITAEGAEAAKATGPDVNPRRRGSSLFAADYFTADVRREIIARYGEDALYEGGLYVRTTLDPKLQLFARSALQRGLIRYDTLRGFRGPVKHIELGADWGPALGEIDGLSDVPEWQLAVVLEAGDKEVRIGLKPPREVSGELSDERETGTIAVDD